MKLKRALTCLAKIEEVNKADYPECHFAYCPDGSWYLSYVEWAYEKGITAGTSDTTFSPKSTLTREQLAALLYAYALYSNQDVACNEEVISPYSDANSISKWAKKGIAWCIGIGIISGTSETTLSPKKGCTRAEMAQMLYKLFRNQLSYTEPEPDPVSDNALKELIAAKYILQKEPDSKEYITRLDFATDIIHITGFDKDIDYYALRGDYSDIEDYLSASIAEISVNQGYLNAQNKVFLPEQTISYSDAIRAFLYALGYREYADTVNRFSLAEEVGLLDGMSDRSETSNHITYAEFGILAKNAINLELVQCINTEGEYAIVNRGSHNTLKNNYLTNNNQTRETLFRIANTGWDIYPRGVDAGLAPV